MTNKIADLRIRTAARIFTIFSVIAPKLTGLCHLSPALRRVRFEINVRRFARRVQGNCSGILIESRGEAGCTVAYNMTYISAPSLVVETWAHSGIPIIAALGNSHGKEANERQDRETHFEDNEGLVKTVRLLRLSWVV